jgi:predicted outer membrane repeat protein
VNSTFEPVGTSDPSWSPHVAAYFATYTEDSEDGEIWAFDENLYEREGIKQWKRWPETTSDSSGDPAKFVPELTAFKLEEPPDWFICGFYKTGFPRQNVQESVYTMTGRFDRDHAVKIAELIDDSSRCHLYLISAKFKSTLQALLREKHGIWRGSLFPDSAGSEGGGMSNTGSSPVVTNCIFSGNEANDGGGMSNRVSSPMKVTNCTFSENSAYYGGGIYNSSSDTMVTNCTFSGNEANDGGGMRNVDNSSPTVTNCIFWGNLPDEIDNRDSDPIVTYSDVEGSYPGEGNRVDELVYERPTL